MKNILLLLALMASPMVMAQGDYQPAVADFMAKLSQDEKNTILFPFNDEARTRWTRLPGKRQGLKLTAMSEQQKIAFHRMLRAYFPSVGYLKITAIMFNEDIQQNNEPVLGRNEYWLAIYGNPSGTGRWGWKLEGHHLSLNVTLEGGQLLSYTPTTFGANPAVTHSDGARDGLAILHVEEELARRLVKSLTPEQAKVGYADRPNERAVFGQMYEDLDSIPSEGIAWDALNDGQQQLLLTLTEEYVSTYPKGMMPEAMSLLEGAVFFYSGSQEHGSPHYYKISNGDDVIEYENYDNHIHWLWRSRDDFGNE